jgi:hypothetical protein
MARPDAFVPGGWLTGLALVVFGFVFWVGNGRRVSAPAAG